MKHTIIIEYARRAQKGARWEQLSGRFEDRDRAVQDEGLAWATPTHEHDFILQYEGGNRPPPHVGGTPPDAGEKVRVDAYAADKSPVHAWWGARVYRADRRIEFIVDSLHITHTVWIDVGEDDA